MSTRFASFLVIPALLGAGVLALQGVDRTPPAPTAAAPATAPPLGAEADMQAMDLERLPPNHPPVGAGASPHGVIPPNESETPALTWTMPPGWQEAANPSAMRLATYRPAGGVEVSVSRAGGAAEANIQRWTSQFDDIGREGRTEKTVRGLHVVTVDLGGTYVGGGAAMGGPAVPRPRWAMVGAIVEGPGSPYFFKMTGPEAAVRAARPAFDHLVDGIAPM